MSRRWRYVARGLVAVWAVALFIVGASLMIRHVATMPQPELADDAVNGVRGPDDTGWLAVHVLYAECRCSQRIFAHLLESTRPAGVTEKVLLVGDDAEFVAGAVARGLEVIAVTPRELATHYRIESAPLLLVVAPDGEVRYSGGYTERKQGPEIEDVELIERTLRDGATAALPLFGCGVSERLRAILDPLGLEDAEVSK